MSGLPATTEMIPQPPQQPPLKKTVKPRQRYWSQYITRKDLPDEVKSANQLAKLLKKDAIGTPMTQQELARITELSSNIKLDQDTLKQLDKLRDYTHKLNEDSQRLKKTLNTSSNYTNQEQADQYWDSLNQETSNAIRRVLRQGVGQDENGNKYEKLSKLMKKRLGDKYKFTDGLARNPVTDYSTAKTKADSNYLAAAKKVGAARRFFTEKGTEFANKGTEFATKAGGVVSSAAGKVFEAAEYVKQNTYMDVVLVIISLVLGLHSLFICLALNNSGFGLYASTLGTNYITTNFGDCVGTGNLVISTFVIQTIQYFAMSLFFLLKFFNKTGMSNNFMKSIWSLLTITLSVLPLSLSAISMSLGISKFNWLLKTTLFANMGYSALTLAYITTHIAGINVSSMLGYPQDQDDEDQHQQGGVVLQTITQQHQQHHEEAPPSSPITPPPTNSSSTDTATIDASPNGPNTFL